MTPFPIFTLFVLFLLFMHAKLAQIDKKSKKESGAFWIKESEADSVRKQPLNDLDYIQIPLDRLPMLDNPSPDLSSCQQAILDLANEKIVNFTGVTNTELKLRYGVANLNILSQYDQNFTKLARELYHWGQHLYEKGYLTEAVTVLEFGIDCHTDISKHYLLLARIYAMQNELHKLDALQISIQDNIKGVMLSSTLANIKKLQQNHP